MWTVLLHRGNGWGFDLTLWFVEISYHPGILPELQGPLVDVVPMRQWDLHLYIFKRST